MIFKNSNDLFSFREEKAIDLYRQLKLKCKSKKSFQLFLNSLIEKFFSDRLWFLSVPDSDVRSDSSEMVKAIIQTVQNQDKVLKDLYTHLRWKSQMSPCSSTSSFKLPHPDLI